MGWSNVILNGYICAKLLFTQIFPKTLHSMIPHCKFDLLVRSILNMSTLSQFLISSYHSLGLKENKNNLIKR